MNLSPRAMELLALQRQKYLCSLPEKRARLVSAWESISQQGWKPDLTNTLKTLVHRLSGSAGSYDLHRLGEAAQRLDVVLARHSPEELHEHSEDLVKSLLSILIDTLDDEIESTSPCPDDSPGT